MFDTEIFGAQKENRNKHSFEESNVVFVADMFENEHIGGAELSTEALFSTAPYKTFKLKSEEVDEKIISAGSDKVWVFLTLEG